MNGLRELRCEHGSLADICPLCDANADALRAEVERWRATFGEGGAA